MPQTPEEIKAYKRAWAQANRERINTQLRTKRAEALANDPDAVHAADKAKADKYRETYREGNRIRANAKRAEDPEAARAKDNARYAKDPESARAELHAWRVANPEKVSAQNSRSREKHKEEVNAKARAKYAENPEEDLVKNKAWRAANPEKVREYTRKRRAMKKGVPVNDLTLEQWELIKAAFHFRCAYCPPNCGACKKKTHVLTRDHVTPYKHNGSNTLWNIVPACQSCNSKKRTGPPPIPVQPLLL